MGFMQSTMRCEIGCSCACCWCELKICNCYLETEPHALKKINNKDDDDTMKMAMLLYMQRENANPWRGHQNHNRKETQIKVIWT